MKRCARDAPATPRPCSWCSTPTVISYEGLLKIFWESHDPTQGMRQGNDVGTQYRSAIYTNTPEQRKAAEASRERYQEQLDKAGFGEITTEIADAGTLLLRGALPPAVPREEPERVLRARRHRGVLPGRPHRRLTPAAPSGAS